MKTIIILLLLTSPVMASTVTYDPSLYCSIPTQYGLSRCNYYEPEVPEVPIPATVWLFMSALGGLAYWRKR